MNILIIIFVIIVSFIAFLLVLTLFIKKEYALKREIIIDKPRQQVFNYIKHLKNQDNFSKWVRTDPNMKKEFRGTDGTVGFVYGWNSKNKNAGKGEQEIMNITEGERVDVEVRFERPFAGISLTPFSTESISENETKVRWGISGRSKYPMNFMNLFMGSMLGKDIEISLRILKSILEKS